MDERVSEGLTEGCEKAEGEAVAKPWQFQKGFDPKRNVAGKNQYSPKEEEVGGIAIPQTVESDEAAEKVTELIKDMLERKELPERVRENLEYRLGVLEKASSNAEERERLRKRCEEDILFWVNTFVWQYNPNAIGEGSLEMGPFIVWEGQEEIPKAILGAIEDRKDLVIEKSREMGASWWCLLVMLSAFLFQAWKQFLMISRSEFAVDRSGDPDSLFWKIDFVLEHMPGWLKGAGIKRRKLGYSNGNGSTITGQASTRKAGVGGRARAMFIDEFSQIDEDYEVLHRTSDTTGCRIFNGTHQGTGTAFAELTRRVDIRKLQLHWTQHPDKKRGLYRWSPQLGRVEVLDKSYEFPPEYQFVCDGTPMGGLFPGLRSPWYDEQCRRKGSTQAVAMDLDIDPQGSVEQVFDTMRIRWMQETHCRPAYWEGDVQYDQDTGRPRGLVAQPGGPLKLWLVLKEDTIPPDVYAAGADISTGNGTTPSCMSIVQSRTGLKVAEYTHCRLYPDQFAHVACALCWLFKTEEGEGAYFAWEKQGPGVTFGNVLTQDLGYRNVYFHVDDFKLHPQVSDKPGWFAAPNSKNDLIRDYNSALMSGLFVNRSREALEECREFKYDSRGDVRHAKQDTGDLSGSRVNHGDHVIADALAWKMAKGKQSAMLPPKDAAPIGSIAWRRRYNEEKKKEEESWV